MKNIIILGGNSNKNINWVYEMEKMFSNYNIYSLKYDNWYNDKEIDIELELTKLINICNKLDDYIIICKSIGSIITFNGIINNLINPKKVIVLGLPIYMCYSDNIDIKSIVNSCSMKTKIMIIEQKNDPVGSSSDVLKILNDDIKFIEIEGNDHHYNNYLENKKIIDGFIGGYSD